MEKKCSDVPLTVISSSGIVCVCVCVCVCVVCVLCVRFRVCNIVCMFDTLIILLHDDLHKHLLVAWKYLRNDFQRP